MRKITYFTLMGCLAVLIGLFSFTTPTSAAAASYTIYVDGNLSSAKTPAVVEKNVTLVPIKDVLADLNYVTTVDKKTKAITAKNSAGSFITVKIGSKKAKINGSDANLAAPAKTLNGTTYIPLSAVKQLTGKSIGLDASEGIAWIGEKPTALVNFPVWGVTPKQVKSVARTSTLIDEGEQGDIHVLLYQDFADDTQELYVFYKHKLAKLGFMPDISGYDEEMVMEIYDGILYDLTESYGQPESNIYASNKDTLEQIPFEDGGYFMSKWKVSGTHITLLLKGTNNGLALSLQYVDASVKTQVEDAMSAI